MRGEYIWNELPIKCDQCTFACCSEIIMKNHKDNHKEGEKNVVVKQSIKSEDEE